MKALMAFSLALVLISCVQTPTKSTQVVDDRPRVAFDPVAVQGRISEYEVNIDGISYGPMSQYLVNKNVLPVVAGRHTIEISKGGNVVFRKVVVLGENTTRVIKVVGSD